MGDKGCIFFLNEGRFHLISSSRPLMYAQCLAGLTGSQYSLLAASLYFGPLLFTVVAVHMTMAVLITIFSRLKETVKDVRGAQWRVVVTNTIEIIAFAFDGIPLMSDLTLYTLIAGR